MGINEGCPQTNIHRHLNTQCKNPKRAYAKLQTADNNSRHFKLELYFPIIHQEMIIFECVNEHYLMLNLTESFFSEVELWQAA